MSPPRKILWLRAAIAVAVVAVVYLWRLDQPRLWDDEADTGIEARNVLHAGYPYAFDGRNVNLYGTAPEVSRSLACKQIPWVQYYLGAASITVAGDSTGGLRFLFAVAGIAAFFPLCAALRKRTRWPEAWTALALLAPQTVLFARNARYYAPLILWFALLLWHLARDFRTRWGRTGSAFAIFLLLYFTHPVAAVCCWVALLGWRRLIGQRWLCAEALAGGAGLLAWFFWYQSLGPQVEHEPGFIGYLTSDFGLWLRAAWDALWGEFRDLDTVGSLPLLGLLAAGAAIAWKRRAALRGLMADPLVGYVASCLVLQLIATAAVVGPETPARLGVLRYFPHLGLGAFVAGLVLVRASVGDVGEVGDLASGGEEATRASLLRSEAVALGFGILAVGTNFLTLSFWMRPRTVPVPVSWAAPVAREIFSPPPSAWDGLIARLQAEPGAPPGSTTVLGAYPPQIQAMATYYLGDRYILPPALAQSIARDVFLRVRDRIGETAFNRLIAVPEWVIDATGGTGPAWTGYSEAARWDSHLARPFDGARPELTRHNFALPVPGAPLLLLRRNR